MAKTAAERQRQKRKRDIVTPENVTCHEPDVTVVAPSVSYAHYMNNPDKYVTRREPEKLNWGPWLDVAGLEQAGLKANRVAIPGDWDYEGTAIFIPGLPLSMPQEAIA